MNLKVNPSSDAASTGIEGAVLDALLDGVVTIGEGGKIAGMNRAAEDMFGYLRDELFGENVRVLMPEPFSSAHDGYLKNYLETGQAKIIGKGRKVTGRRRDGSLFPMHLAISEGWAGSIRIFTGIVRDLTESEAANARLRNSFMLLFERSNEAMFLGDGLGNVLDANQQMCRLLEMSRDQLLRTPVEDVLVGGREENLERRAMRLARGAVSSSAQIRTGAGKILEIRYWEVEFEDESGNRRILIGAREAAADVELARVTAILQALFETSPDGYLLVDDDGHTIFANRAHLEVWGLDRAAMSRPFAERWATTRSRLAEPERFARITLAAREDPDTTVVERLHLIDGRIVEVRSIPIYGDSGERLGRSFATRDVTQQAKSEAEVARGKALLETISQNSPVGVIAVDLDGNLLHSSRRFLEIWGLGEGWPTLTKEEQIQAHKLRFEDPARYRESWARIIEAGVTHQSEEFRSVDGRAITLEVSPLRDSAGELLGRAFFYRDVTEERAAATVLRESEERYRTLVGSLPVGVVMQYADGRIGAANAAAERILGLSQDQLLGLTSFDPRWHVVKENGEGFPPAEHPAVVTLRTGEPCHGVIMGVHHVSGALRWLLVNSEPLAADSEASAGVVVSFLDVTEQRQAEQALAKARTAEAFQSLASGVAHKINNSLASIVGNAYLGALPADVPDATVESLAEITESAADATALVRDLLALSGKAHNTLRPTAVPEALEYAMSNLSIDERERVTVDLDAELPELMVDPASLAQAITNLLRNALEAGESVTARAHVDRGFSLRPGAAYAPSRPTPGRHLVIEVGDDGPGIDPSVADRLFEPFATTRFAGRGLGLAATAGIMATHHGYVEIESLATGCRASLLFPLS